eukprot:scaffold1744_cov340-Prasinococcus_capsulatus_cf.AAC.29
MLPSTAPRSWNRGRACAPWRWRSPRWSPRPSPHNGAEPESARGGQRWTLQRAQRRLGIRGKQQQPSFQLKGLVSALGRAKGVVRGACEPAAALVPESRPGLRCCAEMSSPVQAGPRCSERERASKRIKLTAPAPRARTDRLRQSPPAARRQGASIRRGAVSPASDRR